MKLRVNLPQLIAEKEAAEGRKISLKEIEMQTGVSYLTLNKLRKPEVHGCQFSTIEALCDYFGKTVEQVIVSVESAGDQAQTA